MIGEGHKDNCDDFKACPNGADRVENWVPYQTEEQGERLDHTDFDYEGVPSYDDLHMDGPFLYKDDKALYQGQYKDNKRHGRGKCAWPNGSVYEGEWLNDVPHGRGRHWMANGDWYLGDISQKTAKGDGRLTHADGSY